MCSDFPPGARQAEDRLRRAARELQSRHLPPATSGGWLALKKRLRKNLSEAAGIPRLREGLEVKKHGEWRHSGHIVKNISYGSAEELRITANLYIPDGAGRFPAVLNLHGHTAGEGKTSPEVLQRCEALVRSGFVVLSVDGIGFGERCGEALPEHHFGAALLSTGTTLLGLQVAENRRSIDLLASLPCVDRRRIGVTGESGGGNQTMWVAALDPRICAAVPVVSAGTFAAYVTRRNCWCETLPGGLTLAEEWGVLALMAPRPLLVLSASRESIPSFAPAEARQSVRLAGDVYGLMKAENRLAMRTVRDVHAYSEKMQRHMLGWFLKWLAGRGDGTPVSLPAHSPHPECHFLCFAKNSRPAGFQTFAAFVARRGKDTLRAAAPASAAQKRRSLRRLLRVPKVDGKKIARSVKRGAVKFHIATEDGMRLPFSLNLPPEGTRLSGITLIISASLLVTPPPGHAICRVDLRDLGTTAWDHPEERLRHAARSHLWMGRTLPGNWVYDIELAAHVLRRMFPRIPIELFASDEAALAGLAAAALGNDFARVTLENLPATFVADPGVPPPSPSIHVPGILRWGDVNQMAALARCPVDIISLVHPADRLLTPREAALWKRGIPALKAARGKSQSRGKTFSKKPVRACSGNSR